MIGSMASSPPQAFDVVVVGAGPAGVVAALRAARLGASTALITRDQFGGMAANDGPVPVRTLAQAARLIREARQLPLYGIAGGEPSLDYLRLLARVRDVTEDARRAHAAARRSGAGRGGDLRAGRPGPVRRRPHGRKRQRAAASGRQGHHLHRRNLAAAGGSRLRFDRDAQRRLAPFLGAAVAARDRRWRDRRAGGFRSSTRSAHASTSSRSPPAS